MTPTEALNERIRNRGNDTSWHVCKSCKHSYDDVQEGWNCRKYDAVIVLSNGSTFKWPGQACDRAFQNDCKGHGFEESLTAPFKRLQFGHKVIVLVLVSMVFAYMLVSFAHP